MPLHKNSNRRPLNWETTLLIKGWWRMILYKIFKSGVFTSGCMICICLWWRGWVICDSGGEYTGGGSASCFTRRIIGSAAPLTPDIICACNNVLEPLKYATLNFLTSQSLKIAKCPMWLLTTPTQIFRVGITAKINSICRSHNWKCHGTASWWC